MTELIYIVLLMGGTGGTVFYIASKTILKEFGEEPLNNKLKTNKSKK